MHRSSKAFGGGSFGVGEAFGGGAVGGAVAFGGSTRLS